MTDDAFISIRNVDKHFGKVQAIDSVSIEIGHGEFFSLLGSSGCGKTTLLRMLAGFEAPTGGEIFIDGQPMSDVPPHMRPVNMVFQNYAIFPHLNVRDNIAYGLRKQRLSRTRRHEIWSRRYSSSSSCPVSVTEGRMSFRVDRGKGSRWRGR